MVEFHHVSYAPNSYQLIFLHGVTYFNNNIQTELSGLSLFVCRCLSVFELRICKLLPCKQGRSRGAHGGESSARKVANSLDGCIWETCDSSKEELLNLNEDTSVGSAVNQFTKAVPPS